MKTTLDKYGRDFQTLLQLQKRELAHWKTVLRPDAYAALAEWCELVNGPADPNYRRGKTYRAGGLHSCPVGCELHHFVMNHNKKKLSKSDQELL